MSNTLTGLINNVNQALYMVSRERVGALPAVAKNASAESAALGQTIRVPVAPPAGASAANTPAAEVPDTGDATAEYIDMTISKSQHQPVRFEGEELQALESSGTVDFIQQRFAQAFRALTNEIETDILTAAYKKASRATGTAGTTPFNSSDDPSDFANAMLILDENGAPKEDLHLVVDNFAMANLRSKLKFHKVNEAGTEEMLRDGKIGRAFGFDIHQSGSVPLHTRGDTNGSATLTTADYAIGARTLTLASAGTGGFVDGEMVNIAGENNGIWYGLETGDADTSGGGTLVLNRPGLRKAQTTNSSAVTVPSANWRANLAFHRSAIQFIARTPAMPARGDKAKAVFSVPDPLIPGLVYQVREYPGFHRSTFHVTLAWGVGVVNSEHIAVLFG